MADWFKDNAPKGGWFEQNAPSADRPAGLPAGQSLPSVIAHPAADLKEPGRILADSRFGKRLDSNVSGLINPILHPVRSALTNAGWSDPGQQQDAISILRKNPNMGGVSDVLADAVTAGTLGAAAHAAPIIAAPLAERLKQVGGKLVDDAVGLHLKDIRHGAEPGRAYLEGGGTPSLSIKGIAEKAGRIKTETGSKLRTAYDAASAAGTRIPTDDVLNAVAEPAGKLRALQNGPGGTGVTPSLNSYEDSLIQPIADADSRGGFTPSELFDQMKRPIGENTRWNDPTMYDLNKVRQQTVGRIGGLLTDAVPETGRLNRIYQGSGNLANRATMRAESGQSPLEHIGRRAVGAALGATIGTELHNLALGAIPLVLDTVPAKTGIGYSLFQGGRVIPSVGAGINSIAPLTGIARPRGAIQPNTNAKKYDE